MTYFAKHLRSIIGQLVVDFIAVWLSCVFGSALYYTVIEFHSDEPATNITLAAFIALLAIWISRSFRKIAESNK